MIMYYPTLFTDNFVEDILDGLFKLPYDVKTKGEAHPLTGRMITDVKEYDDKYQLDMELPGFNKEDVKVELKDGYLIVSAERTENNDETENEGKYIRKERYYGKMSRRFYVGKDVTKDDININVLGINHFTWFDYATYKNLDLFPIYRKSRL